MFLFPKPLFMSLPFSKMFRTESLIFATFHSVTLAIGYRVRESHGSSCVTDNYKYCIIEMI